MQRVTSALVCVAVVALSGLPLAQRGAPPDADTHKQWHNTLQKQMKKASRQEANKRQRQLDRSEAATAD